MDDRIARVEQNLQDFRQEVTQKLDLSFRWTIITIVVGLVITWFGAFLLLSKGASLLRRLTTG